MSDHIVQHQTNKDLHQKHDSLSCGLTEETIVDQCTAEHNYSLIQRTQPLAPLWYSAAIKQ